MKAMPGGMTIKLGLVSRPSLVNAANQFGAKATDDVKSYEALKEATDNGQPVLVDIRNGKFPEGHWIVVTGVDENGVTLRRQLSLRPDLDPARRVPAILEQPRHPTRRPHTDCRARAHQRPVGLNGRTCTRCNHFSERRSPSRKAAAAPDVSRPILPLDPANGEASGG